MVINPLDQFFVVSQVEHNTKVIAPTRNLGGNVEKGGEQQRTSVVVTRIDTKKIM